MYESWFRFRRRPFSAAPRTEDYFPSEAAEHARKTTISCVQRAAGPALIIGGAGTGKTTACQQSLAHFRTRTSVGLTSCAGIASRRTFFQNILFEIGRPYRDLDEGELRISLVEYLTSSEAPKGGTVLIFDDAQELPSEQFEDISMLSELMGDSGYCVHLVVSGTVRLEEVLSTPRLESLNQRVAARSYLEPFRIHETEAYVRRQFERADAIADEVFVGRALSAIHDCTEGTPRLINQLCDHALVLGAAGGHSKLDERGVQEAWADLQRLPSPEEPCPQNRISDDDLVEFGDLDDELPNSASSSSAALDDLERNDDSLCDGPENDDSMPDLESSTIEFLGDIESTNATASTDAESQEIAANNVETSAPSARDTTTESDGPIADDEDDDRSIDDAQDGREFENVNDVDVRSAPAVDEGMPHAVSDAASECLDSIVEQLDDYQSIPYPSVDPFAEIFAEEEVVISRPSTMLNRIADRQPEVVSHYGQALIESLDQLTAATGYLERPTDDASNALDRTSEVRPFMESQQGPDTVGQNIGDDEAAGYDAAEDASFDEGGAAQEETVSADDFINERVHMADADTKEAVDDTDGTVDAKPVEASDEDLRRGVTDYPKSGSYEIQIDYDAPAAGLSGAIDFKSAINEINQIADLDQFDIDDDGNLVADDAGYGELGDNKIDDSGEHELAVTSPETLTHEAAISSEQPVTFREPQEPLPQSVRVVELNQQDAESTKPRRRFKQLFSSLTDR